MWHPAKVDSPHEKPARWQFTGRQFARFLVVGIVGTGCHYAVLIVLVEFYDVAPVIATTVGFVVGAIVNYNLNRIVTFVSQPYEFRSLAKFMLVATLGAGINSASVFLLVQYLGWQYLLSQIIATGAVTLWNYAGSRLWVFRSRVCHEH